MSMVAHSGAAATPTTSPAQRGGRCGRGGGIRAGGYRAYEDPSEDGGCVACTGGSGRRLPQVRLVSSGKYKVPQGGILCQCLDTSLSEWPCSALHSTSGR